MKILFRVDATRSGGTGHMSRCLALAEQLVISGYEVIILGYTEEIPWIQNRLSNLDVSYFSTDRAHIPEVFVRELAPDFIFFDSYEFDHNQVNLISKKFPTILILDNHSTKIIADAYINQNLGAEEIFLDTPEKKSKNIFFGAKFAMIRESLLEVRNHYQLRSPNEPVVTCFFGGSKFSNKVYEVSKLLARLDTGPTLNFIVDNSQQSEIEKNLANHNLNFFTPSPNLDKIILESDAVICAAGTSVLEMHCVGIPTAYVPVAKNQLASLKKIIKNESGLLLSDKPENNIQLSKIKELNNLIYDAEKRKDIFYKSRAIVDGWGKKRLINSLFFEQNLFR